MIYEYLQQDWLKKHLFNLRLLKDDLDLIVDQGFEIFVAIDFYDIFLYCFPFAQFFNYHEESFLKSDENRNRYLKEQISRSIMFFMLDKLYRKPNILLPSYMLEADDFILFLNKQANRYSCEGENSSLVEVNKKYLALLKEATINNDFSELVNFLDENSLELIYYYSRGFTTGTKMFYNILKNNFVTNICTIFKDRTPIEKDLFQVTYQIEHAQMSKYNEIARNVQKIRNYETKRYQNERDAEAIYTAYYLNNVYNKYKKAFIFVSSAKHILKLNERYANNYLIKNRDNQFSLIRDIDFFLTVLLSIENHFEKQKEKESLLNIIPSKFRSSVIDDISRIDNYYSYDPNIGGIVLEQMELYREREIVDLNKKMNNIDLALLFDEFLPEEEANGVKKIANLNIRLYNEELLEAIRSIHKTFENEFFTDELFQKNIELGTLRLNYILRNIKYEHKAQQVILFSIPFKLRIKDLKSNMILNRILEEDVKGKCEIRTYGKISNDTLNNIYTSLEELSRRAKELNCNERFILWQVIFLYIGRNDLVDNIYNLVYSSSNNGEKRELTYLYSINFVRKMRKEYISDADSYLKMINILDNYCEELVAQLKGEFDLDLIEQDISGVNFEYKKNYIKSSINLKKLRLNADELVVYEDDSNIKEMFLLRKVVNGISVYNVDLRFIHLRSMIYNRYIHDFEYISSEFIAQTINNFENMYKPLAQSVDHDYCVAIISDYAYMLSLDHRNPKYYSNLLDARDIMLKLEDFSKQQKDKYWGYVRNYILGYIYYKIADNSQNDKKIEAAKNAISYFNKAKKEIPPGANYLLGVVKDKIDKCKVLEYTL